ncbi:MAG: hypothetical protein PHP59_07655 [Methanofollis sp.]|nr:hypothetical protein [Methanofollis sp.]
METLVIAAILMVHRTKTLRAFFGSAGLQGNGACRIGGRRPLYLS